MEQLKKIMPIDIYWHIWIGKDLDRSFDIIKRQYNALIESNLF